MLDFQISRLLQFVNHADKAAKMFQEASADYMRVLASYTHSFDLYEDYRKEFTALGLDPDDLILEEEFYEREAKAIEREAKQAAAAALASSTEGADSGVEASDLASLEDEAASKPPKTIEEYEKEILEYQESLLEAVVFYLRARKETYFQSTVMLRLSEEIHKAEKSFGKTRKGIMAFQNAADKHHKAAGKFMEVSQEYKNKVDAYESIALEYEKLVKEFLKIAPERESPLYPHKEQTPPDNTANS
jgi:hypothetical protein